MFIKINNTSFNVEAFRDCKYETFIATYRGILKGDTVAAWNKLQELLNVEQKEETKQETLFNTDADVQQTKKTRRKRRKD